MVLPRVITAVLLVPLVLAVVWFGSLPFFFFVVGICLFSLWEYSLMADEGGYPNQLGMGLASAFLILLAFFFDGAPWGPIRKAPSPVFLLVLAVFLIVLREFARRDKSYSMLRIVTTVSGVVLFSVSMGHLLLLRDLRLVVGGEGYRFIGREIVFFLVFVIWIVDTGAWFFGRLLGRFHLAPAISPKKTWEGAIAGTALAGLAGWLMREAFLRTALGPLEAALYALVIAVAAQVSDLAESLMKRSFGVKDSSQLLPGHGGVFDRFDSFLFSAPFFYYLLIATGRFH